MTTYSSRRPCDGIVPVMNVHHAERDEYNRLHEAACCLPVDPDLQVKMGCRRRGDPATAPRPASRPT